MLDDPFKVARVRTIEACVGSAPLRHLMPDNVITGPGTRQQ